MKELTNGFSHIMCPEGTTKLEKNCTLTFSAQVTGSSVCGILVRGVSSGSFISSSPPQASWSDNCRFAWQPTDHSEGASVRITISLCRILVYNNLKESGFGVRDLSLNMHAWQGQCCFVKRLRRPQKKDVSSSVIYQRRIMIKNKRFTAVT